MVRDAVLTNAVKCVRRVRIGVESPQLERMAVVVRYRSDKGFRCAIVDSGKIERVPECVFQAGYSNKAHWLKGPIEWDGGQWQFGVEQAPLNPDATASFVVLMRHNDGVFEARRVPMVGLEGNPINGDSPKTTSRDRQYEFAIDSELLDMRARNEKDNSVLSSTLRAAGHGLPGATIYPHRKLWVRAPEDFAGSVDCLGELSGGAIATGELIFVRFNSQSNYLAIHGDQVLACEVPLYQILRDQGEKALLGLLAEFRYRVDEMTFGPRPTMQGADRIQRRSGDVSRSGDLN